MKELDDAAALALKTGDRRGASAIAGFKTLALAALGQAGTALPEARLAKQGDPLSPLTSVSYAQALAGAGRVEESVNVLEEANARLQDGMVWRTLVPFALMVDADRANRAIDERPASTRDETYACWRQIIAAMKTADLQIRRSVVAQLATCNLLGMNLLPHVMLDNLDGAFGYLQRQQRRTEPLDIPSSLQMFLLPARKLRADPRFLQIVKDRGIYQYWLDSGTHPSVCDAPEERDFPVCVELRKDQGK
jgi:hypothetical protein